MTSVNICLPDISSDLDIVAGQEQWLISGCESPRFVPPPLPHVADLSTCSRTHADTITFGGFLLLSGMLADRYGRKLVFNWGMVWFGMWTLINGFAQTKIQLIIFRALQGLGSALTVPSGIGIISNYFKGRDRYRALTIFGSFGAIGFVMGLVLGGIFSHALGWRYVFYISAPFGFATAALGWAVIPKDLEPERPRPALDFIGSFLGCAAMVLLVFVLSSGGECESSPANFIVKCLSAHHSRCRRRVEQGLHYCPARSQRCHSRSLCVCRMEGQEPHYASLFVEAAQFRRRLAYWLHCLRLVAEVSVASPPLFFMKAR